MTKTPHTDRDAQPTRRRVLAAATAASLGAVGLFTQSAAAAPTGTFPEASADPLKKIRADRVRWVGRQSDPGSPTDGTTWYRSDL